MGSSWRYPHVPITPYSIGGFHGLARTFLTGSLVLFQGLALCFDGPAREFTHKWKTTGLHWSKQKNKSAQSAGPTFSQHYPIQVSPHYIQLDLIYCTFLHDLCPGITSKLTKPIRTINDWIGRRNLSISQDEIAICNWWARSFIVHVRVSNRIRVLKKMYLFENLSCFFGKWMSQILELFSF